MSSLDCLFKGTGDKGHGTGYGRARLLLSQIYRQVVRSANQEWNGRNGETERRRSGEIMHKDGRTRLLPSPNESEWRIVIGE